MSTNHNSIDAIEATHDIYKKMTFGGLIRSLREFDEISQVGFNFARKIAVALGYPLEPLLELLIRDQLRNQKLNYIVEIKRAS
jgi:hypothetical protein